MLQQALMLMSVGRLCYRWCCHRWVVVLPSAGVLLHGGAPVLQGEVPVLLPEFGCCRLCTDE